METIKSNLQITIESDLRKEQEYWFESGEAYEYECYVLPYQQEEWEYDYLAWYLSAVAINTEMDWSFDERLRKRFK